MVTIKQPRLRDPILRRLWISRALRSFLVCFLTTSTFALPIRAQERPGRTLTPLQFEIQKQSERLSAADVEERRDAVMRLKALRHPDASRAAVSALKDNLAIVRATASSAVLSLQGEEAATSLLPLLDDKDEFVRQEAAYALGQTRSKTAVAPLIERLARDKKDGVGAPPLSPSVRLPTKQQWSHLPRFCLPKSACPDPKSNARLTNLSCGRPLIP